MKKPYLIILVFMFILFFAVVLNKFFKVQKAHSSFENYYAFRGCVKLVKKTDTYALCRLASGQQIKIVKVDNKWYLDNDLPVCYFRFCL